MTAQHLEREYQKAAARKLREMQQGRPDEERKIIAELFRERMEADKPNRMAYFQKEAERMNSEEAEQEERLQKYKQAHGDLVGAILYYQNTYGKAVKA